MKTPALFQSLRALDTRALMLVVATSMSGSSGADSVVGRPRSAAARSHFLGFYPYISPVPFFSYSITFLLLFFPPQVPDSLTVLGRNKIPCTFFSYLLISASPATGIFSHFFLRRLPTKRQRQTPRLPRLQTNLQCAVANRCRAAKCFQRVYFADAARAE